MKVNRLLVIGAGLLLLAGCGGTAAPATTGSSSSPGTVASAKPAVSAAPAASASSKPAASAAGAAGSAKPSGSSGAAPSVKPLTKLAIALPSATLPLSPVVIADKKGFFTEQGLQVEIVFAGSGSKAAAAVVGGSAQAGASDLGDLLGAAEAGQDIRIFASTGIEPVYITALRRPVADKLGINDKMPVDQRIKATKGLKYAISTPGSGTDSMLHYLLSIAGLDPERDVQILTTGAVVNSYAAAVQGAADAASLSPPTGEQALIKDNMFPLMNTATGDLPQLNGQLQNGLWSSGKWLDANPQLAAAVTAAMWKTFEYMKQSPAEAGQVVRAAAWESTPQEIYDLAWKDALPSFPSEPSVSAAGLKKLLDFTAIAQKKQLKITPEQVIDPKPLQAAKNLLGR